MITITTSLDEAVKIPGEYLAGGTDLMARRRVENSGDPLVDIRGITGLDTMTTAEDGTAALGALVTLQDVAADTTINQHYPGLAQSASSLATPQIRNMATLGGSLLQRTRCMYYRHPEFTCFKKGGPNCPARDGHSPNGVIFDLGPCVHPHPSTMGMALLAYDAQFVTYGSEPRPIAELYGDGSNPLFDHTLEPGEILAYLILPPSMAGEKSAYFRTTSRAAAEWPMVEILVRLVREDDQIKFARIAVGGVANIPLRLTIVEDALVGQPANKEIVREAAASAAEGANPLSDSAYKVDILVGTVVQALKMALM